MSLSVIIPVYNEVQTLAEVVERVHQTGLADEIIVVDDGSTDGTWELLQDLKAVYHLQTFRHERNRGKGAAVRTAIEHATQDILLIQDADLEYNPQDYTRLLEPFEADRADVVYGSRFMGDTRSSGIFWSILANRFLTLVTNVLYANLLSDMETGYKVFKSEVVQDMPLKAKGFDFEPEFTAKILKRKLRVHEVPISFNPRNYNEGKKVRPRDAFIALWTLLKYRLVD
jgi:glycosyltransferase involved in cell wall biosynthesis